MSPEAIAQGLTFYVVLLFCISVHESAHAWSASLMGDDTARELGRISLNPVVHIDPIGTILMPMLMIFASGIPLLAWAKPTPVQPRNFRQLAKGQIIVAGAGPASNFLLAIPFVVALYVAVRVPMSREIANPVLRILESGVFINVFLGVFNLIPLPPLDGSWIASWGLPRSIAVHYDRIVEPYGQWILLGLVVTGVLGWILSPVVAIVSAILRFIIY